MCAEATHNDANFGYVVISCWRTRLLIFIKFCVVRRTIFGRGKFIEEIYFGGFNTHRVGAGGCLQIYRFFEIQYTLDSRTSQKSRKGLKLSCYGNIIWKNMKTA